jgi:hypothetical protein
MACPSSRSSLWPRDRAIDRDVWLLGSSRSQLGSARLLFPSGSHFYHSKAEEVSKTDDTLELIQYLERVDYENAS